METRLKSYLTTHWKQVMGLVLAVILLIAAVYGMLRFGFGLDVLDRGGWKTKHNFVQYLNYYGRPQTGWQYIDGKLYYFAPDSGNMVTGWQKIGNDRYYFGSDGVRTTGWQTIDGKPCYLGNNGKLVTGWQTLDGKKYYFTDDGFMATGWQTLDGKRCYFTQEGMALTGWQMLEEKLYYFTADGYALSGWAELDGVRYRFAEDGAVVTGWFEDESGNYFFEEDGRPYSGWLDWEQKRYYCNTDGSIATGWLHLEQDSYYLLDDGTMAVGEIKIDGVSRFFTSKGKLVLLTNPWHPVPEDYVVKLANIEGFQFDSSGRDALQQMMNDCRAAGFACTINNTYRSKATQQWMWDRSVKKYMDAGMTLEQASAETGKDTALPGHSEHQTGLAVDITGSGEMYAWMAEHCWNYGFILRYPDNKFDITGIIYEPWHFRYVGTELSLELKELGLCMEEYMTMLTQQQSKPAE